MSSSKGRTDRSWRTHTLSQIIAVNAKSPYCHRLPFTRARSLVGKEKTIKYTAIVSNIHPTEYREQLEKIAWYMAASNY